MVKKVLLCLGLLLTVLPARSAILYVRADASGAETNGLSWASAFNTITQAIQHATAGDELWVAAGNYPGLVKAPSGVALYGGFAGDETMRTQRDWSRHKSVIDWQQWSDQPPYRNDLFGPAVLLGGGARLDGFTVINGWHSHGAGVYATDLGAVIANNILVTNVAIGILPSAVLVDRPGQLTVGDDFFLKTANELLRLQFPFAATNIPVAEYSPGVHRLLQIAANIYDAARSNAFPSVFRPQFSSTAEGLIISGYYQDDSAANVSGWLTANPHGIPMVIGACKGFPNFNELALQTSVTLARRLELRRRDTNSPPYQTNEMYIINMSNSVGVEAWNAYAQALGHDLQILIGNVSTATLTTDGVSIFGTNAVTSAVADYPAGSWAGFQHPQGLGSFKVPLATNRIVITNSALRFDPPFLELDTTQFQANSGFRVPDLQLMLSNQLAFVISSGARIIDFVLLRNLTNTVKLTDAFFQTAGPPGEGPIVFCWRTNRQGIGVYVPTTGVQEQIDISVGQVPLSQSQWVEFNAAPSGDMQAAIAHFRSFLFPEIFGGSNSNLTQMTPFNPVRKLVISATWEANDPFVHALAEHLKDGFNNFTNRLVSLLFATATNSSLGNLNARYRPWGGAPGRASGASDFDRRIKDPGVRDADHFDFPNGTDVNIDWLDRIHRGTPWQTLYFDSDTVSASSWRQQSLDPATHPTNDWEIIEYLRGQLAYSGFPTQTKVANNTIVGNEGGLWIAPKARVYVMNNALVNNSSGIFNEGSSSVELSANCVSCSPHFVNPATGDFSLLATSPLIDAGDPIVLEWTDGNVFGTRVDIGALEFGPEGVPVFTFGRTPGGDYELALHGFTGQSYVIEGSTNLVNWSALTTNLAAMRKIILQDAGSTNYTHRFYRAKVANHPN